MKTPNSAPFVQLSRDYIRAKEYLEAIVASSSDAILTTDVNGRIILFSPGAENLLKMSSAEMMGRPIYEIYENGRQDSQKIMSLLRKQGSLHNHEMILRSKEGRRVHVSMSASLLRDNTGRLIGTLGIAKDITTRVELEQRLRDLSITDDLTGLYNKRHLHHRLTQELGRARRHGYPLSIILMDLDNLKIVNDKEGHIEGDHLLKSFADCLMQSIRREVDSAFRYGGDEFVIILPGSDLERAQRVIARLLAFSKKSIPRADFGFSYGVSNLTASATPESLLRLADTRMFRMKGKRRKDRNSVAASISAIEKIRLAT